VRVGADDQAAGESVVFEHHLVDDAGPGFPEPDAVLGGGRAQEVVDLLVLLDRAGDVFLGAGLRADQMVAVHGAGHGHALLARLHELQQGHLRGGVLHGHAVGTQQQLRLAALPGLRVEVIRVRHENFFGQREWTAEFLAGFGRGFGNLLVDGLNGCQRHSFLLHNRAESDQDNRGTTHPGAAILRKVSERCQRTKRPKPTGQ
jgi:hypothetical protein